MQRNESLDDKMKSHRNINVASSIHPAEYTSRKGLPSLLKDSVYYTFT